MVRIFSPSSNRLRVLTPRPVSKKSASSGPFKPDAPDCFSQFSIGSDETVSVCVKRRGNYCPVAGGFVTSYDAGQGIILGA